MEAVCSAGAGLSFRWKSFALHAPSEDAVEAYLRAKAATKRVVAIYAVGAHAFTTEPGHSHAQEFALLDHWAPPQSWIDHWLVSMQRLLRRLEALRHEAGVCVLWKLNNIATRLPGNMHHPSAKGGWHDNLNRFAAALAAQHGVPVIDVLPVTTKANFTQSPTKPEGIASGDMYHAYDPVALWRLVEKRVAAECDLDTIR